ncbi:hypothetical protein [Oryzibacter oryziterrae]|uniref:hypothetical protein n=1 Tax=Oryzibacter oryziterrae TaxID=2766474 RepID=UPI001F2A9E5A|nr:hypothetical protein [Oryzibacter oryziterrae]
MQNLTAWLGPAVIAALISGLVQIISWSAGERRDRRAESRRRAERMEDLQVALAAEIRAHLNYIGTAPEQLAELKADTLRRMADDGAFTPFVPRMSDQVVFQNIVKDIHVLPVQAIDPVILYYKQIGAISAFVEDLRDDTFKTLDVARKSAMYADYIRLVEQANTFARDALVALERNPNPSSSDADLLARQWA